MKKSFALLLVALLLIPSALLATSGDMVTYTGAGYTVSYPADWQVLDRDTIDSVIEMVTEGQIEGIDSTTLAQYKAQIEATNMTIVMSKNGGINVNFAAQPIGVELDVDSVVSMFVPQVLSQLGTAMPGFEVLEEGSAYTAGDYTYAMLGGQFELMGRNNIITQLLLPHGTDLYVLTFTVVDGLAPSLEDADAILEAVAASFTVSE